MFCVQCGMGPPTFLVVFTFFVVLLEPASATGGQNRGSISIAHYYLKFISPLAFGVSVIQALGSLMSRLKCSSLAHCFSGCIGPYSHLNSY